MIDVHFSCLRCGSCCRSLRTREHDYTLGLFLFPKEVEMLNQLGSARSLKLKIFPQQGTTTKKATLVDKPNKIFSYQLEDSTCPFLNEETNGCSIYDERPVACRAFPILTPSPLGFIPDCTWVKSNIPTFSSSFPMSPDRNLDDEIRSASRIVNWNRKWCKTAKRFWTFDLQTKHWIAHSVPRF